MSHNRCMGVGYADILAMQLIYVASKKFKAFRHVGSRDRDINYGHPIQFGIIEIGPEH